MDALSLLGGLADHVQKGLTLGLMTVRLDVNNFDKINSFQKTLKSSLVSSGPSNYEFSHYIQFWLLVTVLVSCILFTFLSLLCSIRKQVSYRSVFPINGNCYNCETVDNPSEDNNCLLAEMSSIENRANILKIERPETRSNKESFVIICGRSIRDKLVLALEVLLALFELSIVLISFKFPELKAPQERIDLQFLIVLLCFTLYICLLTIYRYCNANSISLIPGYPFHQLLLLYFVFLVISTMNLYECIQSVCTRKLLMVSILMFLSNLLQCIIATSSRFKEEAARVYIVPGLKPSPEPTCPLFCSMLCCWNFNMIFTAFSKILQFSDVNELRENDHCYYCMDVFRSFDPRQNFLFRLICSLKETIFINLTLGCVAAGLQLIPSFFINRILKYLENSEKATRSRAWLYVFGLALSHIVHNIIESQAYYIGRRLSVGVRNILIASIFNKALSRRVNIADTHPRDPRDDAAIEAVSLSKNFGVDVIHDQSSLGTIVNLMSIDAYNIADFSAYLHYSLSHPAILAISMYSLYRILGWSALAGVIVVSCSILMNYFLAKKIGEVQRKLMAVSDKRIHKTSELLHAIRIIKFFACEDKVTSEVREVRSQELRLIFRYFICWAISIFNYYALPALIAATCFFAYVKLGHHPLTSSVAFTSLTIINIMKFPLEDLASMLSQAMTCKVSLDRIMRFLSGPETSKYSILGSNPSRQPGSPDIGFDNATLSWNTKSNTAFKLFDISVSFKIGELNLVIGSTGAGKSSLLLALLGEMDLEAGRVYLPGAVFDRNSCEIDKTTGLTDTVAYCSQQAWLINDTIKNNIIFAAPFDAHRYEEVLSACQLDRDLQVLPEGDQTFVGDRGITLSGGQKQRISLARALYSNSKHLILDDCLSAVDSHTAEALYKDGITGKLASGRTLILVSHNIATSIANAAHVVVMENGRVKAQGSPLFLSGCGVLGNDNLILRSAQLSDQNRISAHTTQGNLFVNVDESENDKNLRKSVDREDIEREEEHRGLGRIPLSVYKHYCQALGSKSWWILCLVLVLLVPTFEYLMAWWLKYWTSTIELDMSQGVIPMKVVRSINLNHLYQFTADESTAKGLLFYCGIYTLLGVIFSFVGGIREIVACIGSVRASHLLFDQLLKAVLYSKITFFDTTPIGQIMNRFSKDMMTLDKELMPSLQFFILSILDALAITFVVSYVTPPFIPAGLAILAACSLLACFYIPCSRELKRLESISRSPIFQQFSEVLSGVITIRAYGECKRFSTAIMNAVDCNHRPYFYLWLSNRWLAFWCNVLSMLTLVSAASFIVHGSATMDPGFAGMSLAYAASFGDAIIWIVRLYSQVEIHMNSVERILEYSENEQEAAPHEAQIAPPSSWPSQGEIIFDHLSLRYSAKSPLVIKDVSLKIPKGLKIGIVGRTGAGKSTIITALFRLLEPCTGTIYIDGVDITKIELSTLRKSLSIIPQDPTLFQGTLRSNLDPFNEHKDDMIFQALARVQLVPSEPSPMKTSTRPQFDISKNLNKFLNLDSEVSEGGENFSQGERQLVCLARSLLKSSRILLLDEATASIDFETDAMIQTTIRNEFSHVTILTIAHRLRTIADYDRIIVLDHGEVAEYGTPKELLEQETGLFYQLCRKSGELDELIELSRRSSSA